MVCVALTGADCCITGVPPGALGSLFTMEGLDIYHPLKLNHNAL
jgi:hypothetical protein